MDGMAQFLRQTVAPFDSFDHTRSAQGHSLPANVQPQDVPSSRLRFRREGLLRNTALQTAE